MALLDNVSNYLAGIKGKASQAFNQATAQGYKKQRQFGDVVAQAVPAIQQDIATRNARVAQSVQANNPFSLSQTSKNLGAILNVSDRAAQSSNPFVSGLGNLGQNVAGYYKGQVIDPLKTSLDLMNSNQAFWQDSQNPIARNLGVVAPKVLGGVGAASSAFNAIPGIGSLKGTLPVALTTGVESIRTRTNPMANWNKNLRDMNAGLGTTGLGIEGGLGTAIDVAGNFAQPDNVLALSKLTNLKKVARANPTKALPEIAIDGNSARQSIGKMHVGDFAELTKKNGPLMVLNKAVSRDPNVRASVTPQQIGDAQDWIARNSQVYLPENVIDGVFQSNVDDISQSMALAEELVKLPKGKVFGDAPTQLEDLIDIARKSKTEKEFIQLGLQKVDSMDVANDSKYLSQIYRSANQKRDQLASILSDVRAPQPKKDPFANILSKTFKKPTMGIVDEATTTKQPTRGFIKTTQASPNTAPEVAANVEGSYTPITNKATLQTAQQAIDANPQQAMSRVLGDETPTAETYTMAQDLIRRAQLEGDYDTAINIIEATAKKATTQGQAIQALSMWNRLTPEGALLYAQRLINKAGRGTLDEAKSTKITQIATELQSMPEGTDKLRKTAELAKEVQSVVPASLLQKVSTVQSMAQLLNPKTAIRNVLGNAAFQVGENLSDVVATGVDKALSIITKKRTKVLPDLGAQLSGLKTGAIEGAKDALKGVDTNPAVKSQFDIPQAGVFQNKVGRGLEKLLSLELKASDRAFYQSAYEGSISNQLRASGTKVVTDQMKEIAHHDALYRTFQDNNVVSGVFSKLKNALNAGKEWGLGDLIVKYPKTPGALIARGIDYSPAGFAKALYEASKPLMGKEFNQKAFVEAFGRAYVGTSGLITSGAILHKAGIITGSPEKDKDINALQKTSGLGGYKINISALKRFTLSGMSSEASKPQDGDTLVSYDWIQPFAIALSMGANISENKGQVKGGSIVDTVLSTFDGWTGTLAEQPLIQNLTRTLRSGDIAKAVTDTVKGAPSSFVPTAVNQVNQLTDNTSRNTQDNNPAKEAYNKTIAKIPGLSKQLPELVNVKGETMQRYQDGSNNLFNVMFNPAFVTKLKTDPGTKEALDIYERSGETSQAPRMVDSKIKVNGQNRQLTGDEVAKYQRYVGTKTTEYFNQLAQDQNFQQLDDNEKVKLMQGALTDINAEAKESLFGDVAGTSTTGEETVSGGISNKVSAARLTSIKNKISNGMAVTDSELEDAYLSEYKGMPTGSAYQQALAEDEKFATLNKITGDDNLSEEQKTALIGKLGVTRNEADYYQVATKDTDIRTAFVSDVASKATGDELMKALTELRKEINGKKVLTDGIVDDLYDQGKITKAQQTQLKSTGKKARKSGTKSIKAPTAKITAFKSFTYKKPTAKAAKFRLNLPELRARSIAKPNFKTISKKGVTIGKRA